MARCQYHQKTFLHFKVSANEKTDRLDTLKTVKTTVKRMKTFLIISKTSKSIKVLRDSVVSEV